MFFFCLLFFSLVSDLCSRLPVFRFYPYIISESTLTHVAFSVLNFNGCNSRSMKLEGMIGEKKNVCKFCKDHSKILWLNAGLVCSNEQSSGLECKSTG